MDQKDILRPHAEVAYAHELEALRQQDDKPRPGNWQLSPWAVVTYILGGTLTDGTEIEPKYFGSRKLVEIAVSSLITDRALLLIGIPGTAKTWLSEHLTAAICGDSSLLIQGTAGLPEEAIRYGWNYARLLSEGPSRAAIVASPIMKAMEEGKIARVEELTRMPSDVQDSLITILSEKILPIPELKEEALALRGFNVIATANDRDKGVNELSSALRRRFNTVIMPLPATLEEEVEIVRSRVTKLGMMLEALKQVAPLEEIRRLVTIFRELRSGKSVDGRARIKSPSSTLSPAEAISVVNSGQALATYFGDGRMQAKDLAASLIGAIVKDPTQDQSIWREYLETIVKNRKEWHDLYEACSES